MNIEIQFNRSSNKFCRLFHARKSLSSDVLSQPWRAFDEVV